MTNSAQGERERFEKWAKQDGIISSWLADKNRYLNTHTQAAWHGWQARSALSQAQPDESAAQVPENEGFIESQERAINERGIDPSLSCFGIRMPIEESAAQATNANAAETVFAPSTKSLPDVADPAQPDGEWQMVPKIPTAEMLERGFGAFMAAHDPMFSKNEPCGPIYKIMLAASPPARSPSASAEALRETLERLVRECPFDNMRVENELLLDLDELQHRREWLYAFLAGVELHLRGDGNGRKS